MIRTYDFDFLFRYYLISKICLKLQVVSALFSEVDDMLDEHQTKNMRTENISTPIYVQCENMCRITANHNLRSKGWCIFSDLDIRLQQP